MSGAQKRAPEVRFKEFTDDWEQRKLEEVVERVSRKNINLESTLPLTISAQHGLVDQVTFFNKQVASKDVSNYYLLKNGEFAYNKSYSNGYPWGAVKRLDRYDMGVLSTLYITFKPTLINSNFLVSYYNTNYWHKEVSMRAAEGARNHGLLNISPLDFFDTALIIPQKEVEQIKIGNFFKQLDNTLALHQRKLEKLKQLKQAYLQVLFPNGNEKSPKVRFANFEGDWEQRQLGEIANIISGGTPSTNNEEYWNGDIDWYAPAEIGDKTYINGSQKKITECGLKNSSAKILPVGTVLFTSRAGIGNTAILTKEGATNQGFQSIVPKKDLLNSYFIFSRTPELKRYGEKIGAGSTFVEVSGKQMAKMPLLCSSLEEQIGIGEVFKQLDYRISLHQKKTDMFKELKKHYLQKLFV